ncbi:MAG: GGDEF domain-containing protein [Clostridiales bacterium]|nr:GGDEF domain-containing protein [Clostridiales bacterium]
MKQFQITYKTDKSFIKELDEINKWRSDNPSYATIFHIYSEDMEEAHIKHVCDIIDEKMPDAQYLGCTSNANILGGAWENAKIIMNCTVCEYPTTQAKIVQMPFSQETLKEDVRRLKEYCEDNPWVKAVEIHATVIGMPIREFCEELSTLRRDIQVFGGGACVPNMDNKESFVFSKGNKFSKASVVFLLAGGSDFHAYSTFISGWRPLKRKFKVTKSQGQILYELDGQPAFDIYKKFLKVDRNAKLVSNTLEFPLFMDHNGIDVQRCLWSVGDDDSIIMVADMTEATDVRFAYGDPQTILSSIRRDGQTIADFRPDIIQIFSCASRKAFWGNENISDETILFNSVAPSSGFYTSGEFLRVNGDVCNFNTTLVLAAMREGEPKKEVVNLYDTKLDNIESDKIPLISRLVSFIDAFTAELEELNAKLKQASITDGLTRLYNRAEIERRIRNAVEQRAPKENLALIMFDIDNFKSINDVYGHKEGDKVIIALSDILIRETSGSFSYLGRWGGEEFMVLLPGQDINEAAKLAEKIRKEFASISYDAAGPQTVSVGVVQAKHGENADALYVRVDKALYKAKANGKNQVVTM